MHSCTEVTLGRKSVVGSLLALVGGLGVGQLLCSIPQSARMVLGDILACRGRRKLDHSALALSGMPDPQSPSRTSDCAVFGNSLDLSLWCLVGTRRPDLWADNAVSRPFLGNVGRSWIYGRVRNPCSTHLSWAIHATPGATIGNHHSNRSGNLHCGHCAGGGCGNIEGDRAIARGEARKHSGIQFEARAWSGNVLRSHELMFRIWSRC